MLWGLGVGYVISGMYFGWNLGLAEGGTWGMLLATAFIILLYTTFTPTYTELACSMPKAGGIQEYASRAFGPRLGFVAGMAQLIEFVFAPPAIAAAIGAYFHLFFPQVPVLAMAIGAYLLFTALNIWGVKAAALFELVVTIFAVAELLLFAGITLPHFSWQAFTKNSLPSGWGGAWGAIPFAIWFFLALEGLANVAEETKNPQRNISRGFGSSLLTLVALCFLTFFGSIGVGGWENVVYPPGSSEASDSPLPLALAQVTGNSGAMYHLLIGIGLLGLVASFHGIILAAGRATLAMGQSKTLPAVLGKIHRTRQTPAVALVVNMLLGIAALLTGKTGEIIIMSCFGAITLMLFAALSQMRLRTQQPDMQRPFTVPFYPLFPWVCLAGASIAGLAMVTIYTKIFAVYAGLLLVGLLYFTLSKKQTAGG